MRFFSTIAALVASAAVVSATTGSVTFMSLDNVDRTVYFTPSPGSPEMEPVEIKAGQTKNVPFAPGYIGNFYAVKAGEANVPGMLGEVNFAGWLGATYFDVSAIVDPNDKDNVKQMWPAKSKWPMSGCEEFPCDNAYWHSDDVQTKSTDEEEIICSLGSGSTGIDFAAAE